MAYLFPHTVVPPTTVEILLNLFDELIVLQPTTDTLNPLQRETGPDPRLKYQCPFETGHQQVNKLVSAYRTWAEQHHGSDLMQMRSQLDKPFYFDEESSYQLESLIQPTDGKPRTRESFDPEQELFKSRVFLMLSHGFDIRTWEMEANLGQIETSEARLFAQLHGSQPEAGDPVKWDSEPPGSYMVRERMAAWSLLWAQLNGASNVWVTLFPEVKSIIEERVPAKDLFTYAGRVTVPDDASSGAKWRKAFKAILDRWIEDPAKDQDLPDALLEKSYSDHKRVDLCICRIRQCNPILLLGGPERMRDLTEAANGIVVWVNANGGTF